jgi:hypothetical protein
MNLAFGFSLPYWYVENGKLLKKFDFLERDRF